MKQLLASLFFSMTLFLSAAQQLPGNLNFNLPSQGSKSDSIHFEHRDEAKDSVTISYKYLDSTRSILMDSSNNDFSLYTGIPYDLQFLGNDGAAGYHLIFTPYMKPGWDDGFHNFDAYKFQLEDARFFKTTKPFSQVCYQLATGKEQTVKVLHAQSPKPNINFGFEYRLIAAPGFFVTQNNTLNNYRAYATYQSPRKRYAGFFVLSGNTIQSSENGGMVNDSLLKNPDFSQRYTIPTNLGGQVNYVPNPFSSTVNTGNTYKDITVFMRHTYDFGKKDSIDINDSTTEYLFYPKLRLQYSATITSNNHQFQDAGFDAETYAKWYPEVAPVQYYYGLSTKSTVFSNDFSVLQFPDTKNQSEFFLAGIRYESIKEQGALSRDSFYSKTLPYDADNIVLHGEYRNRTRNKRWDILAKGALYIGGIDNGDYEINGMLSRYLGKKLGNVQLQFQNVNRSPSFIYNPASVYNFTSTATVTAKENITAFKGALSNAFIHLEFADYFITNYAYFYDYSHAMQDNKIINLLQANASKIVKLSKHFHWYIDLTLQQTDNSAPIKVPLLFTRNRLAYEASPYPHLQLSTGVEFRYYTPYKGYNYSPVMGAFMPQDTTTIRNLPDVTAFLDFSIRRFTAYIRLDNLNSVNLSNGFGFTNNNFAAPHYAYPGFLLRVGVQWNFVN